MQIRTMLCNVWCMCKQELATIYEEFISEMHNIMFEYVWEHYDGYTMLEWLKKWVQHMGDWDRQDIKHTHTYNKHIQRHK